ncbi:MAG: hypothetical protein ACI8RZ_007904 [Myxococcota bacterium]|jgi:hypothetical protein
MNRNQILLSLVLADFVALCGYALYQFGLVGMIEVVMTNTMTMAMAADLIIALSIGVWWMWQDARARGVNPMPYALLTATTGSPGLLVYLIKRAGAVPVAMKQAA